MKKIYCLNPISSLGTDQLTDGYQLAEEMTEATGILVRSAPMHELEFPKSLLTVARAGAGVNNIPLETCAERGIVVFNTPGANANAVKELLVAAMVLASRDILGGIRWCLEEKDNPNIAKDVEKAKKAFAGHEIRGKKLGVIGLGAVGAEVANAAAALDMEVYGYDPFISINAAWKLTRDIKHITDPEVIYRECDYITLHVPLLDGTREMINKESMARMKDGVVILNFARDLLVNDDDMAAAMQSGKVGCYVTDLPNPKVMQMERSIVVPHLGASTKESEDNCAVMAVQEIMDYLENGNITNSVNYPDCDMGICTTAGRVALLHKNVPNMIGQISAILASTNMNISNMLNKSRDQWAYTLIDLETKADEPTIKRLSEISGVMRVRVIH